MGNRNQRGGLFESGLIADAYDLRVFLAMRITALPGFIFPLLCFCIATITSVSVHAEPELEFPLFDDQPLTEPLELPDWFNLSFLDFRDDLQGVRDAGKAGLIVYYGQKYCAYCKAFLKHDLEKKDIQTYLRKHFDIVGVDIHGFREVTGMDGEVLSESAFSRKQQINFTPSLVFYNTDGEEALRLRGYYPPYRFRAAMEFVADKHYSNENFRDYLARADGPMIFEPGELNYQDFFLDGPLMLDRSQYPGERLLTVYFEQGDCHACDVLHTGPLSEPEIRERAMQLENVQVSIWADTPVITPSGERTTTRRWAEKLGLFYTPTLIIFDTDGQEIIRIDSVVKFFRLRNVLDYVLTGGYRQYETFQSWRASRKSGT